MKNIHVLPTNNYSPLVHSTNKYGGYFKSEHYSPMKEMGDSYQNIYITNDEEIKEGDCSFYPPFGVGKNIVINGEICFHIEAKDGKGSFTQRTYQTLDRNKKIILTTDQDLIKNGVQPINDEFLEWFVKNPSCEDVKVELIEEIPSGFTFGMFGNDEPPTELVYKIIIPKEEPKQETLEEVAHKMLVDYGIKSIGQSIGVPTVKKLMVNMAKWQAERMHSEEDLKEAFEAGHKKGFSGYPNTENWKELPFEKWFEQFKKK